MLIRLTYALSIFALAAIPAFAATPAPKATLSPVPQGTEVAFVKAIQKDLMVRFPTRARRGEKPAIFDTATRTKTARLATPIFIGRAAIRSSPASFGTTCTVICSVRISRFCRADRPRRRPFGASTINAGFRFANTSITF